MPILMNSKSIVLFPARGVLEFLSGLIYFREKKKSAGVPEVDFGDHVI